MWGWVNFVVFTLFMMRQRIRTLSWRLAGFVLSLKGDMSLCLLILLRKQNVWRRFVSLSHCVGVSIG
jgi:hypothetical protein